MCRSCTPDPPPAGALELPGGTAAAAAPASSATATSSTVATGRTAARTPPASWSAGKAPSREPGGDHQHRQRDPRQRRDRGPPAPLVAPQAYEHGDRRGAEHAEAEPLVHLDARQP